jgi:hypothetical protein
MDSVGPQAVASRREQFKNFAAATGAKAGDRRKQQAVTIGKDRREAMVRAKRVRRDVVSTRSQKGGVTPEDCELAFQLNG